MLVRNKLIILKTRFRDPAYPDEAFYCWHCVLMEGLLASFPNMAREIDVERIAWPRPRKELISLIGADNQSVPVLLLANDAPKGIEAKSHNGIVFINDKDSILHALSAIYGIPFPHP